jgi:hypothetical protein
MYFGMLALGCQVSIYSRPMDNTYDQFLKDAMHYQMLSSEALVLAGEPLRSPKPRFCGTVHRSLYLTDLRCYQTSKAFD